MSVSIEEYEAMYRVLAEEYEQLGMSRSEARGRLGDSLASLLGTRKLYNFSDDERSEAYHWMADEIGRVQAGHSPTENPNVFEGGHMLTPERYSLAPSKPEGRSNKLIRKGNHPRSINCGDIKYDYVDYRARCEKLVLVYRDQGCEDAVDKVQDLLAGKFGTFTWSQLEKSRREEAINFLDYMIQHADEKCGSTMQRELTKSRARKMRRIKRNVKTPKDANYDTLARDGYSHDQIVNMADDNGAIAKPVEQTSSVETHPLGEIRRLFRLPSPG